MGTVTNIIISAGLASGLNRLLCTGFADGAAKAHDRQPSPSLAHYTPPSRRDLRTVLVVLGAHALRTSERTQQVFGISAVIRHPDYHPTTHANDICLLQVSVVVVVGTHWT